MKSLYKLVRQNKILVMISFAVTFLSIGAQLIWTLNIGKLADVIVERTGITTAFLLSMGVLLIGNGFLQYVNQMINRYTSERMAHNLRMNFANVLLSNDNKGNIGGFEAMSKVQNELMASSEYMSGTLFGIVEMALSGVFALFFLLFQNTLLTVIILIPMIIVVIIVNFLSKQIVPLSNKSLDKKAELSRTAYSVISNYDAVVIFDAGTFFRNKYENDLEEWSKLEIRKERINAVCNSFIGILSQVPLLVLFAAGSILIWKGQMTIGMLIIFLNMIKSLLRAMMNMASWMVSVKSFLVHLSRADIESSSV